MPVDRCPVCRAPITEHGANFCSEECAWEYQEYENSVLDKQEQHDTFANDEKGR